MSGYTAPPSVNPYWYYDPHGYQPNVNLSLNTNMSVNTSPHASYDMYSNTSNNGRFVDSGYLSRTPTPPTPIRVPTPQAAPLQDESDEQEREQRNTEKLVVEAKPRLPYVKRTRIQYTLQQLQILEEAFQNNHYPEVTTVDALAELLDVRHEKISIWFQNRRSRFKRQQKPKNATASSDIRKKSTNTISLPPPLPSPSYDPNATYYPPYFWPSPIVDNRTTSPYASSSHTPSFYDPSTSPMWNSSHAMYSSPTAWQQPRSSMNLSVSSNASSPHSLLTEHIPSM